MKIKQIFETKYDAAISLTTQDDGAKETAESIVNLLNQKGLKIYYYLDPEEASLMPGKNLDQTLEQIYSKFATLVILIASSNYAREGYTKQEWEWIQYRIDKYNNENFLIPIQLVDSREKLHNEVSQLGFILEKNTSKAVSKLVS